MAIVLIGHGIDLDAGETFVPDNTTVKFFATEGDNIRGDHVMQILASGSFDDAAQTYPARSRVPNYRLSPMSSTELQRELTASAAGGIEPTFVQQPTMFCSAECYVSTSDLSKAPAEAPAVHNDGCAGLLKEYAGHEIVFLACRGADDGTAGVTEVPNDWVTEWAACVDASGQASDEFVDAFDRLPQDKQAQLLNAIPIRNWSYVRQALQWIESEGPEPFVRYVAGLFRVGNDPEALAAYAKNSRLQELVDEGELRELRELWDLNLAELKEQMASWGETPPDPEALAAEIRELKDEDPRYLKFVQEDPEVGPWLREALA